MVQFLFTLSRSLARAIGAACAAGESERWHDDPLAHPALRSMSQAQLGDLPIGHPRLRTACEPCG